MTSIATILGYTLLALVLVVAGAFFMAFLESWRLASAIGRELERRAKLAQAGRELTARMERRRQEQKKRAEASTSARNSLN